VSGLDPGVALELEARLIDLEHPDRSRELLLLASAGPGQDVRRVLALHLARVPDLLDAIASLSLGDDLGAVARGEHVRRAGAQATIDQHPAPGAQSPGKAILRSRIAGLCTLFQQGRRAREFALPDGGIDVGHSGQRAARLASGAGRWNEHQHGNKQSHKYAVACLMLCHILSQSRCRCSSETRWAQCRRRI